MVLTQKHHECQMQAVGNSANAHLRTGSGVAGAIHRAAGPRLQAYCRQFAPLTAGMAVMTPGFDLPNPWIIHAVAASFVHELRAELILANALDSVMRLVNEHHIESLALPAIGTGVFKCPPELSAAMTARLLAQQQHRTSLQKVRTWKACFEACGVPGEQIERVESAFRHIDDISSAAVRRKFVQGTATATHHLIAGRAHSASDAATFWYENLATQVSTGRNSLLFLNGHHSACAKMPRVALGGASCFRDQIAA
jgi:O-acetyl-ADP-ribose deacetylase (regulator of RNase III)